MEKRETDQVELPGQNIIDEGLQKKRHWQDEQAVRELVTRLNRIEGQIRGVKKMIEEDAYCDHVLNQIASVQSAINGAARLLLEKHMRYCIRDQLMEGDEEVIEEVLRTIFKMIK